MEGLFPCTRCGAQTARTPESVCGACLARAAFAPAPVTDLSPGLERPFHSDFPHLSGYRITEELGRGGMGVVYRATQLNLGREVAIKFLRDGRQATPEARERFRTEASSAGRLQHPNIVAIHETGETQGEPYLVMEWIPGRSLAEWTRDQPLPPRQAAESIKEVAAAVSHAHQLGILHRDLKPANILLDPNGRPKITDFGLAKLLDATFTLTKPGEMFGSPGFLPPEQADPSRGPITFVSDVYALGATLYHLLTGRPPFSADTPAATIQQVLNVEPVAPRLLNPVIPADLETIVLKCLAKEPSKRYPSAEELRLDLGRFLSGEPIHARPPGWMENLVRWARRERVAATALAALVLLAAVATNAAIRINEARRSEAAEREIAEANLYAADMLAVQQAYDEGNLGRARELLEMHRPKSGRSDRRGFEWYWHSKRCDGDPHEVLWQQTNGFYGMTQSRDGRHLGLIESAAVVVFDLESRKMIRRWSLPERTEARSLAFTPNGEELATTERDGLHFHHVRNGTKRVLSIGPCDTLAFSPDGTQVAVCDALNSVRSEKISKVSRSGIYGLEPPQIISTNGGPCVAWVGEIIYCLSNFGTVEIIRGNENSIHHLFPESVHIMAGTFLPSVDSLILALWNGEILEVNTENIEITKIQSNSIARSVRFPQSHHFESLSYLYSSGGGIIYSEKTNTVTFLGHSKNIKGLIVNGEQHFMSCAEDGTIRKWNSNKEKKSIIETSVNSSSLHPPAMIGDSHMLVANAFDQAILVKKSGTGLEKVKTYPSVAWRNETTLSSFLLLESSGEVSRYDVMSPDNPIKVAKIRLTSAMRSVRMSKRSDVVGIIDAEENLGIITFSNGNESRTITKSVWWFSISDDGNFLAYAQPDRISIYDLKSNTSTQIAQGFSEELCFSSDSNHLLIGMWDGSAKLVELATLKTQELGLKNASGIIASLFDESKKTILLSYEDRTVQLINLSTFREIGRLRLSTPAFWLLSNSRTGDVFTGGIEFFQIH